MPPPPPPTARYSASSQPAASWGVDVDFNLSSLCSLLSLERCEFAEGSSSFLRVLLGEENFFVDVVARLVPSIINLPAVLHFVRLVSSSTRRRRGTDLHKRQIRLHSAKGRKNDRAVAHERRWRPTNDVALTDASILACQVGLSPGQRPPPACSSRSPLGSGSESCFSCSIDNRCQQELGRALDCSLIPQLAETTAARWPSIWSLPLFEGSTQQKSCLSPAQI